MELQINIDLALRAIELKSILYVLIFDFLSVYLQLAIVIDVFATMF